MKRSLLFALSEGFSGIRRGLFHSFVAATALALAIAVIGFFYYGGMNLRRTVKDLLSHFQMEAYIALSLPESEHIELQNALQNLDPDWRIVYISRAEAAEKFAREFDPQIFAVLKENPLPASFIISLPPNEIQPDTIRSIARRITGVSGVEDVVYDRELLDLFHSGMKKITRWAMIVGSAAILLAIGLTYNAIRLKIDQQQDAIRLMSLMGATPISLRGIYWVQGALLGIAGGICAACFLLFLAALARFSLIGGKEIILPQVWLLSLWGCFLGLLGSTIAVGRYLKV